MDDRPRYLVTDAGCWEWQYARNRAGYGVTWNAAERRTWLAHVAYWTEANGPVPVGLVIDHLCRNPSCVNPAHLEPVTNAENSRRGAKAKLSADDVREIRRRLQAGESQRSVGRVFGVAGSTICGIRTGRYWAGVGELEEAA